MNQGVGCFPPRPSPNSNCVFGVGCNRSPQAFVSTLACSTIVLSHFSGMQLLDVSLFAVSSLLHVSHPTLLGQHILLSDGWLTLHFGDLLRHLGAHPHACRCRRPSLLAGWHSAGLVPRWVSVWLGAAWSLCLGREVLLAVPLACCRPQPFVAFVTPPRTGLALALVASLCRPCWLT